MYTTVSRQPHNDRTAAYWKRDTSGTKAVRNTANFLIRNTMTAVSKTDAERTENEKSVLQRIADAIHGYNAKRMETYRRKKEGRPDPKTGKPYPPPEPMEMPSAGKWMLSYEFLDYLLKSEKNEAYYGCTSQVNQQAIRKTVKSWKSYFKALQKWKKDPSSFCGKPKIPGYIRQEECTAHYTNQVCKYHVEDGKAFLSFANLNGRIPAGKAQSGRFLKAEVVPKYGRYYLYLTFEDDLEEPEVSDNASRFLGIDTGVTNFLAVANNIGLPPFLVDGRELKAMNQWYNKQKAQAVAVLTRGHAPNDRTVPWESRKTMYLAERRHNGFRDRFYRIGHFLFRYAKEHRIDAILIGHNKRQKDGIQIGDANTQNFVQIPFSLFIRTMKHLSRRYQIPVIITEESYTSKASLLDGDALPVWNKEENETHAFSGRRTNRGLYRSADGTCINADINGAGNIIRKVYPDAFAGQDLCYLTNTVTRITVSEILSGRKHPVPKKLHRSVSRKSKNSVKAGHHRREEKLRQKQQAIQVTAVKGGTGGARVCPGVA